MALLTLALVALAAARLTRLVVADKAGSFVRIAAREVGSWFGERGFNAADELVTCPWCTGWWVALASTPFAAAAVDAHWVFWLSWPWAVSWLAAHLNVMVASDDD